MTGTAPTRVCLFGLGPAGRDLHLPALRRIRTADVAAACDPDERTHAAARLLPCLTDWREAMALAFDAALIATPPATHFELASNALAQEKHVYVEKPMATSLEDAVELVELARRARGVFQVGFAYRRHPLWLHASSLFASGIVRGPLRVRAVFTTARGGTGWLDPVVDLASHHVDLVSWLTGADPHEVEAGAGALVVRWSDGTELEGRYHEGAPQDRVELDDGRTFLAVDRLKDFRLNVRPKAHRTRFGRLAWPDPRLVRARVSRLPWERSYELALRAFLQAARAGTSPTPGAEDGLRAVAVGLATLHSLKSGAPERVSLDPS